jgi:poly(A) polymerase Pap1
MSRLLDFEPQSNDINRMPAGRPSTYTEELGLQICGQLASGMSLNRICKQEGMPDITTVYAWFGKHPEFSQSYARAREDQAETLADEIQDIADDGSNDFYEDKDGNERVDHENIQRSKLRVDARKWIAAKMKPKKYGDKLDVEQKGEISIKVVKNWEQNA